MGSSSSQWAGGSRAGGDRVLAHPTNRPGLGRQKNPPPSSSMLSADEWNKKSIGFGFMGASPAGRPNPECNPVQSRVLHAQLASPHFPLSSLPLS